MDLERAFVALLNTGLEPRPGHFRLFREAVLEEWRAAQASQTRERAAYQRQTAALQRRLEQLDQAYIYERAIDRDTYTAQRDHLREELAIVRLQINDTDAVIDDFAGYLDFAIEVMQRAGTWWTTAATTDERGEAAGDAVSHRIDLEEGPISRTG